MMSAMNVALPDALRSVNATKVAESSKQREAFLEIYESVLREVNEFEANSEKKAWALLRGVCRIENICLPDADNPNTQINDDKIGNYYNFLMQYKYDRSTPKKLVSSAEEYLLKRLEWARMKHEHVKLYSDLVTEWLPSTEDSEIGSADNEFEAEEEEEDKEAGGSGKSSGTEKSYIHVEASSGNENDDGASDHLATNTTAEMKRQKAAWEELVFTKAEVDEDLVQKYLKEFFLADERVKVHFKQWKKEMRDFCSELRKNKSVFSIETVKVAIQGLLAENPNAEKTKLLKTIQGNDDILFEICDVLNMRFVTLNTWKWTNYDKGIEAEMRKQLNGKYRVYMDVDVLDSILIHAIGMKFAAVFRKIAVDSYRTSAWKKEGRRMTRKEIERREYYGVSCGGCQSVHITRQNRFSERYLMAQLPKFESDVPLAYNSEEAQNKTQEQEGPMALKHGMLHMVIADAIIDRFLHPERSFAVVRSDFKWFGPSLPHQTIEVVLRFFGVDDFWLSFFDRFLNVPIRFAGEGPNGAVRQRVRGVPLSQVLSTMFGEAVLFVMDFAFNQITDSFLYRLHDDFWFWGDVNVCKVGWAGMERFAKVMGIEFNQEKTGSVVYQGHGVTDTSSEGLPVGDVRWGFLTLDRTQPKFQIDQDQVNTHIKELRMQLSYTTSVFAYVKCYNAYLANFFTGNFGKASVAFGETHIEMMIEIFTKIQNELFEGKSVVDHLAGLVEKKFGVSGLPEGFWYWPIHRGGLDLKNPLVPLLAMKRNVPKSVSAILASTLEAEEDIYIHSKTEFEKGIADHRHRRVIPSSVSKPNEFLTFEEYNSHREHTCHALLDAHNRLMELIEETNVNPDNEIAQHVTKLPETRNNCGLQSDFNTMTPYWRWMVTLYGGDVVKKYGSLQIADTAKIPVGVVGILKATKIKWRN